MATSPQVSIIVPIYKVEKYLDECVQSILSQSFQAFEIILVDDGSPDACPQMCDSYAARDSRVRVIHIENGGQANARNVGLSTLFDSLSTIDNHYVVFVDSDDRLAPGALQFLYDKAVQTDADIVLGAVNRFTENGVWRPYTSILTEDSMTGREALKLILEGRKINISVCGALYKLDVWNNIRMPKGYIFEDWYVMPDLFLPVERVVFTPVSWYEYRDNPKSTMSTIIKRSNPQVIDVAEHVISIIKATDESLYCETLWSNLKRVWKYVGIIYTRSSQREEKEFLDKARVFLKKYFAIAKSSGKMGQAEIIGVWSFCYCEPLCALLYKIK